MSVNSTTSLPAGLLVIKQLWYSGLVWKCRFLNVCLALLIFGGHEKKRQAAILPKSTQAPCCLLVHQLISSLYFLTFLLKLLLSQARYHTDI